MNLSDPHLLDCIRAIVSQTNVGLIVETGTYHGEATAWLAREFPALYIEGVEIDPENARLTKEAIAAVRGDGRGSWEILTGSSDEVLRKNLNGWTLGIRAVHLGGPVGRGGQVLLLLDAHFNEHWPLLAELQEINRVRGLGHKLTVVIDDFFTDRPNFQGCYDGLRGDDGGLSAEGPDGRKRIRCGYNEPFAPELDRFPHCWYPDYPEPSLGYVVVSDFDIKFGSDFRRVR